jgi:CheY-like chemotaxis protein
LKGNYLREAPEHLAATRKMVEDARSAPDRSAVEELVGNIYLRVHMIAAKAALDKLPVAAGISATLEALLKRLYGNLGTVSDSTLNTVSLAIKLLEDICSPDIEAKLACHPDPRILVVDDEPLARRAIVGALQLVFEQPDSANDGVEAAALAAQKAYDVVFTDLQMPGKNGCELCVDIRASELNRNTPVVFITNHADVEAQNRARASGGNDFIGKPFLPIEIAVKALIFTWDSRLRKTTSVPFGPLPERQDDSTSRELETATLAA